MHNRKQDEECRESRALPEIDKQMSFMGDLYSERVDLNLEPCRDKDKQMCCLLQSFQELHCFRQ